MKKITQHAALFVGLFTLSGFAMAANIDDQTTAILQQVYREFNQTLATYSNGVSSSLLSGAKLLLAFSVGVKIVQGLLIGLLDDDMVDSVKVVFTNLVMGGVLGIALSSWPKINAVIDTTYTEFVQTVSVGAGGGGSGTPESAIQAIGEGYSKFAGTGMCFYFTSLKGCSTDNPQSAPSESGGTDGGSELSGIEKIWEGIKNGAQQMVDGVESVVIATTNLPMYIAGFFAGLASAIFFLLALFQYGRLVVRLVSYIIIGIFYIKIGQAFGILLVAVYPLFSRWTFNLVGLIANGILYAGVAALLSAVFVRVSDKLLMPLVEKNFPESMAGAVPLMVAVLLVVTLFLHAIPSIQGIVGALVGGGGVRFGGTASKMSAKGEHGGISSAMSKMNIKF